MNKEYDVATDPNWTLAEWAEFIERMVDKYSSDAKMWTDGGYNNVTLWIETDD